MASPRGNRKKKSTKKILIPAIIAVVIFLLLLVQFKGLSSNMSGLAGQNQQLVEEVNKLKEEAKKREDYERLKSQLAQKEDNTESKDPKQNEVSVVVAKVPIKAGTRLSDRDLETKQWPESAKPTGHATYVQQLIGRITSSDIASGEPILPDKLIDKDAKTLDVPRGYRAMTIPVSDITGVAGFITPGSSVDLLTVVEKAGEEGAKPEKVSRILIQDVQVLAVSGRTTAANTRTPGTASAGGGSNITVAVPAKDAIKVALAYNNGEGNIQVVLRGYQDATRVDKTSIDTGELVTGVTSLNNTSSLPEIELPRPAPAEDYVAGGSMDLNAILSNPDALPPPQAPMPQTKTHTIEIIQANTRQEVSFETEI